MACISTTLQKSFLQLYERIVIFLTDLLWQPIFFLTDPNNISLVVCGVTLLPITAGSSCHPALNAGVPPFSYLCRQLYGLLKDCHSFLSCFLCYTASCLLDMSRGMSPGPFESRMTKTKFVSPSCSCSHSCFLYVSSLDGYAPNHLHQGVSKSVRRLAPCS